MLSDVMPERALDERDSRTGWERSREVDACGCGRATVVRGLCAYCLHAEHAAKVAAEVAR